MVRGEGLLTGRGGGGEGDPGGGGASHGGGGGGSGFFWGGGRGRFPTIPMGGWGFPKVPTVGGGCPTPPGPSPIPRCPRRRSSWPRAITCSSPTRGRSTAGTRVGVAGAWPGCGLGVASERVGAGRGWGWVWLGQGLGVARMRVGVVWDRAWVWSGRGQGRVWVWPQGCGLWGVASGVWQGRGLRGRGLGSSRCAQGVWPLNRAWPPSASSNGLWSKGRGLFQGGAIWCGLDAGAWHRCGRSPPKGGVTVTQWGGQRGVVSDVIN